MQGPWMHATPESLQETNGHMILDTSPRKNSGDVTQFMAKTPSSKSQYTPVLIILSWDTKIPPSVSPILLV